MAPELHGLLEEGPEVVWWTFAGGRISATLRYALVALDAEWQAIPDNLRIRIAGDRVSLRSVSAAIAQISEPAFWADDALGNEVREGLSSYRLSKFQPLMPPWVEREVLGRALLDVAGAADWLRARCRSTSRPDSR